ncbi:hypothetical protein DRQ50_06795, partial [bacterium]
MHSRWKFRRVGLLPAMLMITILTGLGGCGADDTGTAASPVRVRAVQVDNIRAPGEVSVSGSIEPIRTIRFGFLVPGRLAKVAVGEGDMVAAGGFVASLEPDDYRHGLQIAEAKNQEVQAEYRRLESLHDQGSLTDSDFDKIDAGRREAEANAAIWRKKLADTRLTSPMAGTIAYKGVEYGETVAAGQPVFAVVRTDSLKAVVGVPESEIGAVRTGQDAVIRVPALDNGVFSGRVVSVGAVADPFSRSYSVQVTMA